MPKVLDTNQATVWYHPEGGIVHHFFKRPTRDAAFRQVLEVGLEQMIEHGATKWLSDERNNSALTPEDSQWIIDEWVPRALEAGWRHWAIVLPDYVVGKMDMALYIATRRQMGTNVYVFTDPAEALEWLASPDPAPYPLPDAARPPG
jgi:hypothetical protein